MRRGCGFTGPWSKRVGPTGGQEDAQMLAAVSSCYWSRNQSKGNEAKGRLGPGTATRPQTLVSQLLSHNPTSEFQRCCHPARKKRHWLQSSHCWDQVEAFLIVFLSCSFWPHVSTFNSNFHLLVKTVIPSSHKAGDALPGPNPHDPASLGPHQAV